MTKVISLFNQAGGQGKTTLTFNLGYHLVELKHRVLLIDLDAQSNLTSFTGREPFTDSDTREPSVYDTIFNGDSLPVLTNIHGMDIVPSDSEMYRLDWRMGMAGYKDIAIRLHNALKTTKLKYDYVLLDCPPSLGMASINALFASSHVLIPIETAMKGLQAVNELFRTVSEVERDAKIRLNYAGVVPMHYDKRNKTSPTFLKAIEQLRKRMPVYPPIPIRVDFDYAWNQGLPVAAFNSKSDVIPIFQEIVQGLEEL